ncbi:uncharacterized protein LOC110178232 [Drosophila serrata]|uniref:uncharacterized protein LOC110178232 n=1 Tax=Drosophila serrata TaxID=7274 RepID=UPI000A1D2961|nr:uncharacterized protein LOC110178232 [Drosophila serrata]
MDKFLHRNPTWKTKTYGSIVASAANKKPSASSTAASQRRPLQDSNVAESHWLPTKSQSQSSAADLQARTGEKVHPSTSTNTGLHSAASKAIAQYRSELKEDSQTMTTAGAEARTPKHRKQASEAPSHGSTTPSKQNSQFMRMQQDLNSPSAALRLRALRALKSPTKSAYNNFDVSHTEHSIITTEERNPKEPPTLPELLKDVVIYVEVRTGNDNRSDGVRTVIAKMGAQVNDRLRRNTTHVVFKDGLLSTYKKAMEWQIPVVSILWIEACKVQRKLCDPSQFPISNIHKYEYPELFGKIPRVRCMPTDYELKNWVPKRQGTPKSSKDTELGSGSKKTQPATPTTTPKNDISRFFRALSHKKTVDDETTESPATTLLNRISSGSYTPLPAPATTQRKDTSNGSGDAVAARNLQAQRSLSFTENPNSNTPSTTSRPPRRSTVEPTPVTTTPPVRTSRRRSCAADYSSQPPTTEPRMTRRRSSLLINSVTEEADDLPEPVLEPRMTRRRSSLNLALKPPGDSTPKQTIETISEELAPTEEDNNSIVMEETIKVAQITNCVEQSLEISAEQAEVSHIADRRGTLYASETMDITAPCRRSIATSTTMLRYDIYGGIGSPSLHNENSTMEEPLTPIFSSTRLPGVKSTGNRRRTLFNIDLNVVNENIERMNESHRRSLALANEAELGECRVVPDVEPQPVTETPLTEPKRRRLFNPNDEVVISPPKSSRKRMSMSGSTGSVQKRRRSMAVIPSTTEITTETPAPNVAASDVITPLPEEPEETNEEFLTPKSSMDALPGVEDVSTPSTEATPSKSSKPRARIRTLVHTNMHQEQILVIRKALRKLRGMRLDPTVTQRTTHLVSLEPRRTLNLLRGLMRGVWIVNYQWVLASMRAGKWVNEEPYELKRFSRAIEICRTERQAFGIHYHCELFRFMQPFYVSSLCRPIQFNNIKELLLLGGAKLTENRFKAKYVIGDKRRAEDDRLYLSPLWVLDSITNMQIQKFGRYLMKSAIVTPEGIQYECAKDREMAEKSHKHDFIDPPFIMDK